MRATYFARYKAQLSSPQQIARGTASASFTREIDAFTTHDHTLTHPAASHTTDAPTRARPARIALAVVLFLLISFNPLRFWDEFFYLFSVSHHTVRELLDLETHSGFFPAGFFSGKLGFVLVLSALSRLLGLGMASVLVMQLLSALVIVAFVGVSWLLFRELFPAAQARASALTLLVLPLTFYLSFKLLTEVPALCLESLGALAFLRSFRAATTRATAGWLALAALGVFAGAAMRFTSWLFFAGLVAGLLAHGERWKPLEIAKRAAAVAALGLVLGALWLSAWHISPLRFLRVIRSVTSRTNIHAPERIYSIALATQLFVIPMLLALRWPWSRSVRFALAWLVVCGAPFVIGHEPRYYHLALVPMAILAAIGLTRALSSQRQPALAFVAAIAVMALVDRYAFVPLMPYEVDERSYPKLLADIDSAAPNATIFVAAPSDYAFLRVAYPDRRVMLAYGGSDAVAGLPDRGASAIKRFRFSASDQWWAGVDHFAGSPDAQTAALQPWVYVGWTYNPAVIALSRRVRMVGVHYLEDPAAHDLKNHEAMSWIWWQPSLNRVALATRGQYTAFRLTPTVAPEP